MTQKKTGHKKYKLTNTLKVWILMMSPVIVTFGAAVLLKQIYWVPALAGFSFIGIILLLICRQHIHNLDTAIQYLLTLNDHSEKTHPDFSFLTLDSQFYNDINHVKSIISQTGKPHEQQQIIIQAVLNSLPFPFLIVNHDLKILQANNASQVLFERPVVGLDMGQLMRSPEVLDTLGEVFTENKAAWREFKEHAGIEAVYRVHIAPFKTGDQTFALVMIEDVTEHRRSEQMRVDFIANASHEIRTPLTAVRGMIETIQGPAQNDFEAQKKFLGLMSEQMDRLYHLVEDLMSLSRIELHEHSRPNDRVDVLPLVSSITRALDWDASKRHMSFQVEVPTSLPPLLGEQDEVERLISNLVVNAIKYGDANSNVRIAAYFHSRPWQLPGWRGGESAIAIAVADQGPGILKEHIPRLTERFYRVDAARSRDMGGTGLGLAIVKHIIQRHRGALTIESSANQGSVFTAYFPVYNTEKTEQQHVIMT